jgi:hypothetical protein
VSIFVSCLVLIVSLAGSVVVLAENQTQILTLDRQSQSALDLTVYHNFALVRDVRDVVLPVERLLLEYQDVASTLKPGSVVSRSLGQDDGIRILEQSYRYDLLNRESLLATYIGRKLKYSRTLLQGDVYEKVLREGILLSTNPEIVDFGDEIEISPEGTISLPSLPDGLSLSPTLFWLVDNPIVGQQQIETTYIANNVSWKADYVFVLDDQHKRLNLAAWATIRNDSGAIFNDVQLKLVAGNVNQVQEQRPREASFSRVSSMSDSFAEVKALAAYQSFELPRLTRLLNHEEKQIQLIEADGIKYAQQYRLQSQVVSHAYPRSETPVVTSEIQFSNSEANKLGLPLPEGIARAYLKTDGVAELVGESRFSASPRDQNVTVVLGQAFDLTATRQQLEFSRLSDRNFEAIYEIELSNSKDDVLTVIVDETMQGDWQVLDASDKSEKLNSGLLRFEVKVPARGKKIVRYQVRWRA